MGLGKRLDQPVRKDAEAIAIEAISYLAERPEDLARFISLAGVDPAHLRQYAGSPEFLGGVLDYFLGDEPLLLAFTETRQIPPTDIAVARRQLGAADDI